MYPLYVSSLEDEANLGDIVIGSKMSPGQCFSRAITLSELS